MGGFLILLNRLLNQLHRLCHAHFAMALVADEQPDGREANEDVDEPFDLRYGTEDQVDNVPVCVHKAAQANETPVEAADDKEDERYHVKCFHGNEIFL
jgi:hypothetical protein